MDELQEFPVRSIIEVAWGDMDAGGHINNSVYFTYLETARIHYFERSGLMDIFKSRMIFPMIVSTTCDFIKQIRYPDTVTVGSRVTALGTKSCTMEYGIFSAQNGGIAARGRATVVFFSVTEGRTIPISDEIKAVMRNLEQHDFAVESKSREVKCK